MTLYRYTNTVSNSEFARHTHDRNCKLVDSVEVDSMTAKSMLDDIGRRVDLMILNCEGGELHIMRSMFDDENRSRVAQICVSFHDPRIYATKHREEIIAKLNPFYHIVKGNCPHGGIPDLLFILKQ